MEKTNWLSGETVPFFSEMSRIAVNHERLGLNWHPDGKSIFITEFGGLAKYDIAGTLIWKTPITSGPIGRPATICFSPDRSIMICNSLNGSTSNPSYCVSVVQTDSGRIMQEVSVPRRDPRERGIQLAACFAMSPDGRDVYAQTTFIFVHFSGPEWQPSILETPVMDSIYKPPIHQHFDNMIYHPTRDLVVMTGFFQGYAGSITFFKPSSHAFETVFATEMGIEGVRFINDRTIIFALNGGLMFSPGFVSYPDLHISKYVEGGPTLFTMDLDTRVVAPLDVNEPVQSFDVGGGLCLVRTTALHSDSQLSVFDLAARKLLKRVSNSGSNPAIRCHADRFLALAVDKEVRILSRTT